MCGEWRLFSCPANTPPECKFQVRRDAAIIPGLEAIPLPAGAQSYSVYVAGIASGSKQVDAAKGLIAFLTSPAAEQALTDGGFERP